MLIIGSDQIDPTTGDVKNKTGSVAAAKFARRTICVASTDKLAKPEMEELEENDAEEVTRMWPIDGLDMVLVRNVYFEWIPGKDMDGYVTENGILGRQELQEIYWEREKWQGIWKVLDQ
jgi:translation initiation factor 2B subunit (eIF-2B alpha/beta/delta family)